MKNERDAGGTACSLEQHDLAQRHERWQTLRARAAVDVARTSRGLRLAFRADPGVEQELAGLVALERDCCAFADWSVQVNGTQVVLEISGDSDEAIAAVQGMFTRIDPAGGTPKPIARTSKGLSRRGRERALVGALGLACLACLIPGLLAAGAAGSAAAVVGGRGGLVIGIALALGVLASATYLRRRARTAAAAAGPSCGC